MNSRFAVFLALGMLAPLPAAAVPSPATSHCDPVVIGNSSGSDMGNAYHVVVRDAANSPVANKPVAIWFSGSTARPDLEQEPGTTTDCAALTLTRTSDAAGGVVFHARVAGFDNTMTARVAASGVVLALVRLRSTDIDGDGGTDLRDVNEFRQRFVFDRAAPETDFNQDGVTNGYDFELLRDEFMRGVKGTVCP